MLIESSHLVESLSGVLVQLADIVSKVPVESYTRPLPILSGSSVGKHVRHSIEFVEALLSGRENETISYDRRERNPLYEDSPSAASDRLGDLASVIRIWTWNGPASLSYVADPFTAQEGSTDTYWERELLYVQEHTIHHDAMIRIGLEYGLGFSNIPSAFGFAFSTIQFERSRALSIGWDPVI
ncbi:hypothetical protein EHO61_07985 [Leptospira fluminis]|uniref:DinB family protein n=1 Tax=Leptospira fluminis TaxID=2484979 RepID=A0A4R9GQE1_9LEPT|nr:hypothetical protein [Leptospira fluminis]TGK19401.1 hypothetical protein EHO61_07985 [Leptospira fluminis]